VKTEGRQIKVIMNYIFLSPYFPNNFYNFCVELNNAGVNVLGIGDTPYEELRSELKSALTEYYRVDDMEDYSQLLRACGYFTYKYGKIDRIESHNEYWLETDARLRTDFNVQGLKSEDTESIKYKSKMKEVYNKAGINTARGQIVSNLKEAEDLIKELGFPVVVKPDKGVGAADTYKLKNRQELIDFFDRSRDFDYIMEEYIDGEIQTFDGLIDQEGNIVFSSSLIFNQGIMETVNQGLDISCYIPRKMPEDIVELGLKTVEAFKVRERFFHFEYFKLDDGRIVALEVNIRPPGGPVLAMFNYANDINIYRKYAKMIAQADFDRNISRKYNCFYIGRKNLINYQHSLEDILNNFGDYIVQQEAVPEILAPAIGDYGIILRTKDIDKGHEAVDYILAKV